jgi:hypothetical protein
MPVSTEAEEAFDRRLLIADEESGEAEVTDVIYASSHAGRVDGWRAEPPKRAHQRRWQISGGAR